MSKRLVRTVRLSFFEDDANGEWGTAHSDTIDNNGSEGFNAFWNGVGLFHDVFEHAHEYQHKYFRGSSAMNIGGEMAAMGSFVYYVETLGVYKRYEQRFYTTAKSAADTTAGMVAEGISDDHIQFGDRLECSVPYQRPVPCPYMDDVLSNWFETVNKAEPYDQGEETTYEPNEEPNGELFTVNDPRQPSLDYKKSFTFRKVASLHRWGWNHARRLVSNTCENQSTLTNFLAFWDKFCKENSAETLGSYFFGITFRLYKTDGEISWKAVLNPKIGAKRVVLTEDSNTKLYEEDYIDYNF